jgi:1-acyl-sn-glycerol-3-phosphate acyltransferase
MLRAYLFLLFFVPWTIFCAVTAMLSTIVDKSGRMFHRFALLWSRIGMFVAGARLKIEGSELVPSDRPLIFMCNHQSNFDIMSLIQASPVRFTWLAKEELFKVPIFGSAMRAAGYIPINRGDGRDSLRNLARAAKLVESGTSIAIFPEGTRSEDGALIPFKRGGFILAEKAGAQIVPVSISGSREINPPDNFFRLKSGTIKVRFGNPIPTAGAGANHGENLARQVRESIAAGLES